MEKRKNKPECGDWGFIDYRKKRQLIITLIFLVVILAVYFSGWFFLKTRNSLLTVFAILLVLPMAKVAVSFIILLKRHSISKADRDQIQNAAGDAKVSYDMIISSNEKLMQAGSMVIYNGKIYIYATENKKTDDKKMTEYIRDIVRRQCKVNQIVLYHDLDKYVANVQELCSQEREEKQRKIDEAAYKELYPFCIR